MIAACKTRVVELFTAQTPPVPETAISLGKEGLGRHLAPPQVVLITGKDETQPAGDIVARETDDAAGVRRYTYRRAVRRLQLAVVVFHRTEELAESILLPVIDGLLDGFLLDGQPVTAYTTHAGWVDPESLKRRGTHVTLAVEFEGGIYKTKEIPLIQRIDLDEEVM